MNITIGCTATDFPPLRGSKPAREPGVTCTDMKYILIGLMFFSSMLSADQDCRWTDEYRQIAREARDIVYGDENSFSKCEHSVRSAAYWRAMATCTENQDGVNVGGGCAHLVSHKRYKETIDLSHCQVFKFEPTREMVDQIIAEEMEAKGVKRCDENM